MTEDDISLDDIWRIDLFFPGDVVFYKESTFHEVLEVLPYSIYDEVIGEFVTFDNEFNLKINCGTISRWVQSSQVRKVGSAAG